MILRLAPFAIAVAVSFASFGARAAEHEGGEKKEGGHEGGEEAPADAGAKEPSDHYVHHWLPMPTFTAQGLGADAGPMAVEPRPGRMQVIVFLASFCEPCQELMDSVLRLEKRYTRLNTDFVFVFAHDTLDDAQGFMKEFQMPRGILANFDALKAYHNPNLPTIYVGDRHGWLMTRFENARAPEVEKLDALLKNLTAY